MENQVCLIHLRSEIDENAEAKCLAVNPIRTEYIAVGANDPYARLYDRRMLKPIASGYRTIDRDVPISSKIPKECVTYFCPGHITKNHSKRIDHESRAITHLTFNATGTELLALLELGRLQDADECLKELMRRFPGYATNHGVIMLNDDIKENMQTILQQQQEQRRPAVDMLDRGEMSDDEFYWRCKAKDYTQRFVGHCNTTTDIKEANYFGFDGHYIVAGSDDAAAPNIEERIIGGYKIDIKDVPFIVSLQTKYQFCGGSLLAKRYVLTAATVLLADRLILKFVWLLNMLTKGLLLAAKIYQHSEYNPTTISYDFSIVQLEDYEESSLPFPIQYAQLPAEDNIEDGRT
ncbi:Trypsin-1 [Eumeta japonica]|uniref:Trypsin-1 n=1 Tax=Eumeta variegata TaxID=151549 RepID=A0A4C1TP86_EUMVA|nr:Trypsin-1 [Eumeta japonica]